MAITEMTIKPTPSPISQSNLITECDGKYRLASEVTLDEMYKALLEVLNEKYFRPEQLVSSARTKQYLQLRLAKLEYEVFCIVYMDSQHRVIETEELFRGTIDGATVYPREVVKRCLEVNAAAVIFSHSHPSGIPELSSADVAITNRLKEALQLIDVKTLDHIVIGAAESVSFAERGLI